MSARTKHIQSKHAFSGERLQTYSDAVFSIIATFSVIPLKFSSEIVERRGGFEAFNLEHYLLGQWHRYFVYLYSFGLVADVWFVHTGLFSLVEHVDDVILWLNLLLLFLVSFLPYGTALVSSYASILESEQLAIAVCAGDLFLISVVLLIILIYVYRRQSYLHPDIASKFNIRTIKIVSIILLLIQPIIAVLAIGFSFLSSSVPWLPLVLFYSIGVVSVAVRLIVYTYFRLKKSLDKLPQAVFRKVANKARTEAFSDGVFAIVATLIVLDLTTEHLPEKDTLVGDLNEALYHERFVFLSYMTIFIITGLLWFVQYSMFHYIKKFTPALSVVNVGTLFVIGGFPFVAEINSVFADETFADPRTQFTNKLLSIQVMAVMGTLAGTTQLIFWCVAHYQKSTCMSELIEIRNAETLVFIKTMILPFTSIIVYWASFLDGFIEYHLYTAVTFSTPFIFLLFIVLLKKCSKHHTMDNVVDKACKNVERKPPASINQNMNTGHSSPH